MNLGHKSLEYTVKIPDVESQQRGFPGTTCRIPRGHNACSGHTSEAREAPSAQKKGRRATHPPKRCFLLGSFDRRKCSPSTDRTPVSAFSSRGADSHRASGGHALTICNVSDGTRNERRKARKEDCANSMDRDSWSVFPIVRWIRIKFGKGKQRFRHFFNPLARCLVAGVSQVAPKRKKQHRISRRDTYLQYVVVSLKIGRSHIFGARRNLRNDGI